MRIAVLCNDTRGGVVPYVALARGLAGAGHHVCAVAPGDLAGLFRDAGIATAALSGDLRAALAADGSTGGAAGGGTIASQRLVMRGMAERLTIWTRETLAACTGCDLLLGGIGGMIIGLGVAQKLGVPFLQAHLQPVGTASADYPGVLMPRMPHLFGGPGRRLSHRLSEAMLWMPFRGGMARAARDGLGLARLARPDPNQPILYGFSRHVVPVPTSAAHPRHATGYWMMDQPGFVPPPALAAFLALPGPCVSIGFGSMPSRDPQADLALLAGAARDAGVRVVVLSGWSGLDTTAAAQQGDVFVTDALPHDWLFAQMRAVVHHGGAGTTGAALAAGVPAVVVPFAVDQPFWGARVAALGAGPPPIPRNRLSRALLADALRHAANDSAMAARAQALGHLIRAEDGVGMAVGLIETFAAQSRPFAAS